jgi:hypothetical protein
MPNWNFAERATRAPDAVTDRAARPSALRKQPGRASCTIPGDQPFNLSSTDPKPLCGSPRHQTLLDHGFYDL